MMHNNWFHSIALGVSIKLVIERVRDSSVYKDNDQLITQLKAKKVTDAVTVVA